MRVAGSRVLITGAGHGLGFAIAGAFARAGATVVATDVAEARVQAAVAKLPGSCGYVLDVTNSEQIAEVRSRLLAEQGPLDILVNNAGVVFGGPFLDVPVAKHATTVNVNFTGLLAVTHAFLPDLLARPVAHVVNIASASAFVALPNAASYAATKWAVLGFSESLIEELRIQGHRHVGVSAICPAFIATGMFDGARPTTLTQFLKPEDVAAAVVRAVEKRREVVILPRTLRVLYALAAGWPRSWYHGICRAFGASTSMAGWKGHSTQ